MGRCKSLESLNSFLSYAPQLPGANLVSLFILLLAFPQLLSNHHREWQHPLDPSFGSLHSHLEVRKCWWLWHLLFINMAGDIFISHSQPWIVFFIYLYIYQNINIWLSHIFVLQRKFFCSGSLERCLLTTHLNPKQAFLLHRRLFFMWWSGI